MFLHFLDEDGFASIRFDSSFQIRRLKLKGLSSDYALKEFDAAFDRVLMAILDEFRVSENSAAFIELSDGRKLRLSL